MRIYISNELEEIKREMELRGYYIVEDNTTQCDAIICNLKNCDLLKMNMTNSLKKEGTLIIDSGCKSIDDIDYILNNKAYSSLF